MKPVSLYWKPVPGGYSSGTLASAHAASGNRGATALFGGTAANPALWVRIRRMVTASNRLPRNSRR